MCFHTSVFDSNSSNNQNNSINHCSPVNTKMWIFDFGSVWRGFGGLTWILCWVSVHWGLIWRVIITMWLWDIDDKWEWYLNENTDLKMRNTKMEKHTELKWMNMLYLQSPFLTSIHSQSIKWMMFWWNETHSTEWMNEWMNEWMMSW